VTTSTSIARVATLLLGVTNALFSIDYGFEIPTLNFNIYEKIGTTGLMGERHGFYRRHISNWASETSVLQIKASL